MHRFKIGVALLFLAGLISCGNSSGGKKYERMELDQATVQRLVQLPLNCLQKEFPNKLNQTLGSADEIGLPSELHPAFYGCFDWHSSVHGHWLLVKSLKLYPGLPGSEKARTILSENITRKNVLEELAYFQRPTERSFERTYGWAWLLKLAEELYTWNDTLGTNLYVNLEPLTDHIVQSYMDYLPKLVYPIRSGEHTNTAFGLSFALDFARVIKNDSLENLIIQRALDFYLEDENCPITWEPGGYDFFSPCLQEIHLMKKVLDPSVYKIWAKEFLPGILKKDFKLAEAKVSDRSDGKLVHLDGLNFSRAWCLYGIAGEEEDMKHLIRLANRHIAFSIDDIVDGSYSGEHWLASFALYSLTVR